MPMLINRLFRASRLFARGYRKYKKQIVALSALGVLSGILEGVGVNAIIPLFSFISNSGAEGTDLISRGIAAFFRFIHLPFTLKYLLILMVVLFLVKALMVIIFGYINVKITTGYEKDTRSELLSKTLKADWPYLLDQKIGYLEQALVTDVARASALLRHLAGTILLVTNVLMYVVVALNISPLITLVTVVIGAVLFYLFKPMFYKARKISEEQAQVTKKVANLVNENMIGIKTIKAAGEEKHVQNRANDYFENLRETSVRVNFLSNTNNALIEPIGIIFIVILFAISYKLPAFSFASFAVIIYLIQKIFSYLQVAQNRLQTVAELVPYLANIIRYQDRAAEQLEIDTGKQPFDFRSQLEFRDVGFHYADNAPVLQRISFKIGKGEMLGLIGPSGAGKTTLVDLLLRLLKPQSGAIVLDGKNVEEISLKSWREAIGYVSQDIFLLNDTIENNIKFYEDIPQARLIEAAKMANIFDFIKESPQGFDTLVGERGMMLSGGQRQRIILARVLARKPQLLILDEATSAIDTESEFLIQAAIEKLKGKVTVLTIAHRLSTVVNSDRIMVLSEGRIVEEGEPKKLLQDKSSYFSKIYNLRGAA